jgi:hypothetical protein
MVNAFGLDPDTLLPPNVWSQMNRAAFTQANKPTPAPTRVGPGQQLYDRDGNLVATGPPAPTPAPTRVSPGQVLTDRQGNVVYTAPPKPDAGQKPATRNQFARLDQQKATALGNAEKNARKRLAAAGGANASADDQAEIYSDLRTDKQAAQDAYEAGIEDLTGAAPPHFEYPQVGAAAAPPQTAAPARPAAKQPALPGAGRSVSEADLRRRAVAGGQNPDAAVQQARGQGYRITR